MRRKGMIWFTLLCYSLSLREVMAGTQAGSRGRNRRAMLPSGSPHGSWSAVFLKQPRPACLGMLPAHSRLDPPTMRKCPTDLPAHRSVWWRDFFTWGCVPLAKCIKLISMISHSSPLKMTNFKHRQTFRMILSWPPLPPPAPPPLLPNLFHCSIHSLVVSEV